MNNNQSLFFALGLGQRAGKVLSGDMAVTEGLKKGKVKLLLVAKDASEKSKSKLAYYCKEYKVPMLEVATRSELGLSLGKAPRTAAAIVDENFVKMVLK